MWPSKYAASGWGTCVLPAPRTLLIPDPPFFPISLHISQICIMTWKRLRFCFLSSLCFTGVTPRKSPSPPTLSSYLFSWRPNWHALLAATSILCSPLGKRLRIVSHWLLTHSSHTLTAQPPLAHTHIFTPSLELVPTNVTGDHILIAKSKAQLSGFSWFAKVNPSLHLDNMHFSLDF